MSTQPGNVSRSRPQKYQNATAFKNTLHDTSVQTKKILNVKIENVCARCKDIIEWKIKYKKYKSLTVPRKCVKCEAKTVKSAYHIACSACAERLKICAKCGAPEGSESRRCYHIACKVQKAGSKAARNVVPPIPAPKRQLKKIDT